MSFFKHQLPFIWKLVGLMREMKRYVNSPMNLADFVEKNARRWPNRDAVVDAEGIESSLTWSQFDALANQIANWALSRGLTKGDQVALYMDNIPIYPVVWVGLGKVGVVTALINSNQEGKALSHSINVVNAKMVITQAGKTEAIEAIRSELDSSITLATIGPHVPEGYLDLRSDWDEHTNDAPERPPGMVATDPAVLIYTSGTTGLPKAAIMTHLRCLGAGSVFARLGGVTQRDVIYTALPLYHSAGGVIGVGSSFTTGAKLVVRRKFSATHFISDCKKHECTVAQYIGEILRYLLTTEPGPSDRDHKLRMFLGNGLRPDIWDEVVDRFGVTIFEFYGATEGNVTLLNPYGMAHAVGYMPPLLQKLLPYSLVKFDLEKEAPVRDSRGFCQRVKPGEVGEAVGQIRPNDPVTEFRGYTNKEATAKKLLENVFSNGDRFFRTGDLLRMDEQGFVYFVDRIGDTFRWKGENVATTEVSEVINTVTGIKESVVYGVEVTGHDGRAGMAALVLGSDFDLDVLARTLEDQLPIYARPLFLRILPEPDLTGTFKHQKSRLKTEGYSLDLQDDVLVRDAESGGYRKLDQEALDAIAAGARI
ncbi:MAG: long-chain-acyl-CoA synthetase [Myxococcota bacterium]|nr:long-chain-acyl-CoA synthetase [Myxococcota bacterium]